MKTTLSALGLLIVLLASPALAASVSLGHPGEITVSVSDTLCQRFSSSSRLPSLSFCAVTPPPTDVCLNVPGNQASGPCADQQCTQNGGTWNGTSCTMPPSDTCPNVPGNQRSGPCADAQCRDQGGTWTGTSCALPTPPPPPPSGDNGRGHDLCQRYISSSSRIPIPASCDICPNVLGVQVAGLCADKKCVDDGGTWSGNSCVMPPPDVCPNVPGNQTSGPCADLQCTEQGGTWNGNSCVMPPPACSDGIDNNNDGKIDFPADLGCSSAADNDETGPSGGGAGGGAGGGGGSSSASGSSSH